MKPIYIGLAGKKRAGKDTIVEIMRDTMHELEIDTPVLHGQLSFADPMYRMLECLIGPAKLKQLRDSDDKDVEVIEPYNKTLRHMAQTLGTEWGRDLIHPDIWVLALQREANVAAKTEIAKGTPAVVFVPDVRFPNEAQFIRDNGILVHVRRAGHDGDAHVSEQVPVPEEGEPVIHNNGTLDDLKRMIRNYVLNEFTDELTAIIRASTGNSRLLSE